MTGPAGDGSPAPAPARRRGRPPRERAADGGGARRRILESARTEFSERGYDKTSVRGIAKAAGVDAALVHHYFGTKDEVFEAAIEVAMDPVQLVASLLDAGPEHIGEQLARSFLGIWENPATRAPLLAIMRSALTHEAAANVVRGFVFQRVLERVAADLDVPDPQFRAELAASHMLGVAMMRYVLRVEPLASADVDAIVTMVAPTLQRYLTE
ncbi:TetR family transcriptional regulator [Streptomyces sp. NBC_00859]|uniref:TetR/AcrR family transcriptional regulator n=1 Tax=Streptomyces sp. NBC_00859 TaxID=2903682 RepID=UPI003866E48E|nr:TetR family transcriptional regulator [Streptomyces sp. NBC_00859]